MTRRAIATAGAALLVAAVNASAAARAETTPTPAQCAAARAAREVPPTLALDPKPGAARFFAMQFKQEIGQVETYATYRTKIECMIRDDVLPHLARGAPNVVAFNEDVGLATVATGSRGAQARAVAARDPSCESEGLPCGVAAALAALDAGYSRELSYYRARFPSLDPRSGVFVAATDTFARGFMQTFSDMARRYGVYILGSNDQAPFVESRDPADIAALADPDLPRPDSVYVATSPDVHNEAFLWAPHDVRSSGPPMLRNLVASNLKVPLTPIEQELGFVDGPSTGPAAIDNVRPYAIPGSGARIAFATSLPAFVYGSPPSGTDPCSDTASYYMRCLDELGANVVVQDEANNGRWAGTGGNGYWQPLEWMESTYRAVADPSVHFDYNVDPMMVGNLVDLAFDGQSAITQRGLGGAGCHYVGNQALDSGDGDPASAAGDAGDKPQFLALAPWVTGDSARPQLRQVAAQLAPGSGDPLENDYVETALVADLTFPPDPSRPGCARPSGRATTRALRLRVHPRRVAAGRRVRLRLRVTSGRTSIPGALIRIGNRRARSGRGGRATIRLRLRAGAHRVVARRPGFRSARARLRAVGTKRRRHR